MKSNSKKFLAMFLAVLFVMSTMVTSAFAKTDDEHSIFQIEELRVTPQSTTNYVLNRGGSIAGYMSNESSIVNIFFTVPKTTTYRLIVSASGGDILVTLDGIFAINTVSNHTNLNKDIKLFTGKTYQLQLINYNSNSVCYCVLAYEK